MQRKDLVIGREYFIHQYQRTYSRKVLARYLGERSRPHRSGDTVLAFQRIREDGSAIETTATVNGTVLLQSARWVVADRATYERQRTESAKQEAERNTKFEKEQQVTMAAVTLLRRATGLPFTVTFTVTGAGRIYLDLTPEILNRLGLDDVTSLQREAARLNNTAE